MVAHAKFMRSFLECIFYVLQWTRMQLPVWRFAVQQTKQASLWSPPPPPPKGLRGRSEETFPSYLPNSCCLFWLKSIALWMDLKFLRKHCFSLGCSSQVIVKWVRFGLKIRWEIQTFFTSFFCMIIREGRNDNNSNNVKRELCDKRFCYMLIQNWLQLSKLHQSGSQGEQFTPAGSHEETYMEILGTGVWAEIRKDKGQRSAPPGNCVKPLLALEPKGPGEERALFTKAQVMARAGYWGREEWGRKDPTSISLHPPVPCQCLPRGAAPVKPAGKGGLWYGL